MLCVSVNVTKRLKTRTESNVGHLKFALKKQVVLLVRAVSQRERSNVVPHYGDVQAYYGFTYTNEL